MVIFVSKYVNDCHIVLECIEIIKSSLSVSSISNFIDQID